MDALKYASQMKTLHPTTDKTHSTATSRGHDRSIGFLASKSEWDILLYGLVCRILALIYCIFHDSYVDHIKYTDIDYHVFTNGSRAVVEGRSPYEDPEYRYTPAVALIFVPNILANVQFGKLLMIAADIIGGHLLYQLNIQQGTHRIKSKYYLALWLLNPMTVAISTRGSFEPFLSLVILGSIYSLATGKITLAGLLFGLSIHFKLYPIIYCLTLYFYMVTKKPYLLNQAKINYWIRTLSPNTNHLKFFAATAMGLLSSSLISYKLYGQDYLEQSFLYHLKRKDLQHNFSPYFYIFRLCPNYQDTIGIFAFLAQFVGVLIMSVTNISFDNNKRARNRKLSFSLFVTTFLFVSLNKVCTSQYFSWYLIFVPLIIDSIKMSSWLKYLLATVWFSTQAVWLLFAYLYEYRKYDVLDIVGCASILFLVANLWILSSLCFHYRGVSMRRGE